MKHPDVPQHTPTPWQLKEGLGLGSKYWVGESEDGKNTPFQSTKEANAAFIVRAVNVHEDLLHLLRSLATHPERLGFDGIKKACLIALAKAEGK